MKVGLITIIGYSNYGNRLQNYAVQEFFKQINCIIETINNPVEVYDFKYTDKVRFFKKIIKQTFIGKRIVEIKNRNSSFNYTNQKIKQEKFRKFTQTYIKTSNTLTLIQRKSNIPTAEFDYFIVGSDQVWNYDHYRGSWIDFLQFAPPEKRIAYAASIGLDEIPKKREAQFKEYISGMKYISVREQRAKEIIEELTDKKADVVLDPTLVLTAEQWSKISTKPSIEMPKKYILLYFLGKISDIRMSYIKEYAQINECSILDIDNLKDKENNIYVADPGEWVYLIANCQCMFTDSFHGCVFSIIHHKDFEVFHRIKEDGSDAGMFSRIETLTSMFKLENRIQEENNYQNKPHITTEEFSYVDNVIKYERERTYKLLKGAMSNDKE